MPWMEETRDLASGRIALRDVWKVPIPRASLPGRTLCWRDGRVSVFLMTPPQGGECRHDASRTVTKCQYRGKRVLQIITAFDGGEEYNQDCGVPPAMGGNLR